MIYQGIILLFRAKNFANCYKYCKKIKQTLIVVVLFFMLLFYKNKKHLFTVKIL